MGESTTRYEPLERTDDRYVYAGRQSSRFVSNYRSFEYLEIRRKIRMTTTSHSDFDRVEFVIAMLDWLESRDEPPEAVDDAFALLADQRRRLLLDVMRTYGEELTLPDAAEEVAVRESGCKVTELSAERVANVYISLYHDHLPRLVDAGLLEYDQERDLVAPVELR